MSRTRPRHRRPRGPPESRLGLLLGGTFVVVGVAVLLVTSLGLAWLVYTGIPPPPHALFTGPLGGHSCGGNLPAPVALFDPDNGQIYVITSYQQTVSVSSVFNGSVTAENATWGGPVANITVGGFPTALALDPSTGDLFVSNAGPPGENGYVSIISGASERVLGSVNLSFYAYADAYASTLGEVFVAGTGTNISVISVSSDTVVRELPGGPGEGWATDGSGMALAWDPASALLFVAAGGGVTAVDPTTGVVLYSGSSGVNILPAVDGSNPFVYDPATGNLYLFGGLPGGGVTPHAAIAVVSGTTGHALATVPVEPHYWVADGGLMLDPSNGMLYASTYLVPPVSWDAFERAGIEQVDPVHDQEDWNASCDESCSMVVALGPGGVFDPPIDRLVAPVPYTGGFTVVQPNPPAPSLWSTASASFQALPTTTLLPIEIWMGIGTAFLVCGVVGVLVSRGKRQEPAPGPKEGPGGKGTSSSPPVPPGEPHG